MRPVGEPQSRSARLPAVGVLERGGMRICAVALLVLLGAISCQEEDPGVVPGEDPSAPLDTAQLEVPPDSLTRVLIELEPQVAPVMEEIERARVELRADSGSVTADSAFVEFFRGLEATVREAVRGFDDPAFQALLWPDGGGAQFLRREDPSREAPTPRDRAMADSVAAFLTARGIWWRRAEGSITFASNEAPLLARLGPYLTPAMQEFLRQRVHEQVHRVADDAAIMIPVNELAERALWAERFLETHPGSIVHDVVLSHFEWYLAVYVGGLPNTRPFELRTGVVRADWRESFEAVASERGNTTVGRVASEYLGLLEASGFTRTAETDAFVREMWEGVRRPVFP